MNFFMLEDTDIFSKSMNSVERKNKIVYKTDASHLLLDANDQNKNISFCWNMEKIVKSYRNREMKNELVQYTAASLQQPDFISGRPNSPSDVEYRTEAVIAARTDYKNKNVFRLERMKRLLSKTI